MFTAGTGQTIYLPDLLASLGGLATLYHSRPAAAVAGWAMRRRLEQADLVEASALARLLNALGRRETDAAFRRDLVEVGRLIPLYYDPGRGW